jgi:Icc-related predicted phosphoesterase
MRILAVSDIEKPVLYEVINQQKIGKVDLIVSCGDLSSDYLSYISTIYGAPLFMVRGNHDRMVTADVPVGENLHRRLVTYKSIRMMGFEGVPCYTMDAVQYSEYEMDWMVRWMALKAKLSGRIDLVVTHAPPAGIHEGGDYSHRGFPAFTKVIRSLKPRFFLHGHTHLNYDRNLPRMSTINQTTVINVYGYYVFEIKTI